MKIRSFDEFWRDVTRLARRKRKFCTVGMNRLNIVTQVTDEYIWVKAEGGKSEGAPVSKELFRKSYELLKHRRKIRQTELVKTVKRSAFVFSVLAHLPYFRVCTNPDEAELKSGYEFH